MTGNISNLYNCTNLTRICFGSGYGVSVQIYGDISILTNMPNLVDLDFRETVGIYGDISVFRNYSTIRQILISYYTRSPITGDISILANCTNLEVFISANTPGLTGDISSLRNLTNLRELHVNSS